MLKDKDILKAAKSKGVFLNSSKLKILTFDYS